MILFQEMTTDESLSGQEFIIKAFVCSTFEDPDGCNAGVLTWWRKMAHVLFSEIGAAHVCTGLEPDCDLSPDPPPILKEWNCEVCKNDVMGLLNLLTSTSAKTHMTAALSGTMFCQSPDLGLTDEQISTCQNFIEIIIPPAMDVLFDSSQAKPEDICYFYYDGICPE